MQRITRTDNDQGIPLTVTIERTGALTTSSISIESDEEKWQFEDHNTLTQTLDWIMHDARSKAEHISTQYRNAALGGWAVTFIMPVGHNGELSIYDRWLFRKLMSCCPAFQTTWNTIEHSGSMTRILRQDDHFRVQIAPEGSPAHARTFSFKADNFTSILEHIATYTSTAAVKHAAD
ncbi:hypothetical protein [Deinococcus peraridilitoris]|uniref:Uncharacterized protein n=1 Tax=Deinococcus peraridilitoris (strain DSM 19664 / LMG 22246 / CIP 109416 / KR-200) TaxID=937777 RepID=L0A6X1_DEIPD|nr:hypothetical protein [Deinococcus peraridilitoris]AFZ69581.1 hypothetical protein Deipe_4221 [Deinococcus peraridilitoris DSM 19664]